MMNVCLVKYKKIVPEVTKNKQAVIAVVQPTNSATKLF